MTTEETETFLLLKYGDHENILTTYWAMYRLNIPDEEQILLCDYARIAYAAQNDD